MVLNHVPFDHSAPEFEIFWYNIGEKMPEKWIECTCRCCNYTWRERGGLETGPFICPRCRVAVIECWDCGHRWWTTEKELARGITCPNCREYEVSVIRLTEASLSDGGYSWREEVGPNIEELGVVRCPRCG